MKDLLITHTDLDGISPIILLNLAGRTFDYKSIEISEVEETFNELFQTDLSIYENIYITDLTLPQSVYDYINENNIKIKVFDHHETHLYANEYDYTTIKINLNGQLTCGTELFYLYLKDIYKELDAPLIKDYVNLVREIDTYQLTSDKPKHLVLLCDTYGKADFIKSLTKRLKKDRTTFEFTAFEKRFIKIKADELLRYMQKMEKKMLTCQIDNRKCGVVFAESNKSELGNYLSNKYPELDLIILIDASSRISYRTSKDDIKVNEFASTYGGGGHQKASGSAFTDKERLQILSNYFKDVKQLEDIKN